MNVYIEDWAESGREGMLSDFGIDEAMLAGAEILLASYSYENYEGEAFVLFKRDGKLFEVHGNHCSCYGLSEQDYSGSTTSQWDPEETSVEALRKRFVDYPRFTFPELLAVLEALEAT